MYYLSIKDSLVKLKKIDPKLDRLFIEVNDIGEVCREIGFASDQEVIHAYPSRDFENKQEFKHSRYGLFDLQVFETLALKSDITKLEFENIWKEGISTLPNK